MRPVQMVFTLSFCLTHGQPDSPENAPIGCHKRSHKQSCPMLASCVQAGACPVQTDTFRQLPPSFASWWNESGGLEVPSSNLGAPIGRPAGDGGFSHG